MFKHPIVEVFGPESENPSSGLEGKRKSLWKLKVNSHVIHMPALKKSPIVALKSKLNNKYNCLCAKF